MNFGCKMRRHLRLFLPLSLLILLLPVFLVYRRILVQPPQNVDDQSPILFPRSESSSQTNEVTPIDHEIDQTATPTNPSTQRIHNSHVPKCTSEQLAIIKKQLPPDDCRKHRREPYTQKCSLSYATRCPDATWLEDYYTMIHTYSQPHTTSYPPPTFLAIFVGCNKGMDAVNALRMGSGNSTFDKFQWRDAMTQSGKVELGKDVCNQASAPQFVIPERYANHSRSSGGGISAALASSSTLPQVHCIEPMPATARALLRSAHQLRWDRQGFVVTHAAMSKEDGTVLFPLGNQIGVENKGIANCLTNDRRSRYVCVNVTMYSLDTYVETFISAGVPINYLSIDVEGYDMDVLLGGQQSALARVHYLEFEYNWMGSWKNQYLSRTIEWLDTRFGFTCYWAGFNNTIWRITNCWLDHYDIHFWSNVACVNRNVKEVRMIAASMEKLFIATLARRDGVVMNYENRFKRKDEIRLRRI